MKKIFLTLFAITMGVVACQKSQQVNDPCLNCDSDTDTDTDSDIDSDTDTDSDSDTDIVADAIYSGAWHTCAIMAPTDTVRCWGLNNHGQLGYGNTQVVGIGDITPATAGDVDAGGNVEDIAIGGNHTCALLSTGNVRCWGSNESGQLGYGNTDTIGDDETPASVGDVDIGENVIEITAGILHTCALLSTGNVRCWGASKSGQTGYGSANSVGDDETPASVGDIDIGENVVTIAAGGYHTCALLSTGNVRCWGENENGQLGYGNTEDIGDDETPASVGDVDIDATIIEVKAGGAHSCIRTNNGGIRCWGENENGQLGYGNTELVGDDETPTSLEDIDLGGEAIEISAGYAHTCSLLFAGNVRCWGYGYFGQLGYGNQDSVGDNELPNDAGDVPIK